MGLYNFKPQFEADIRADKKRHTIRDRRKYPDKPGALLSLYVGLRTKKCRLLKRRRCTRVQSILIRLQKLPGIGRIACVDIAGETLTVSEQNLLAKSDGFPDFQSMMEFWEGRLPFEGDLIHWESDSEYARRIGAPWEVVYPLDGGVFVVISKRMKLTEADALRRAKNARGMGVPKATVRPALPPEKRTKKRKRK